MPATTASGRAGRSGQSYFYVTVAILTGLLVFVGFAPSFYLKGALGPARDLSALTVGHGVVMTTWYVLFFLQATLIARKRPDLHRRAGVAGAIVAMLIVVLGSLVQFNSLGDDRVRLGALHAVVASIAPFFDFAVLVGCALYWRKKADVHKRLMLLATLTPLGAAIGRFPIAFCRDHSYLLVNLLILACVAYDTWRYRRLHPAFVWGTIFLVAMDLARRQL
jgi:hypothetical protein